MGLGLIRAGNSVVETFIYEGENIAAEYPSGELFPIPSDKVHMMLRNEVLPDGTPCKVLLEKTPMTRLEIVVI